MQHASADAEIVETDQDGATGLDLRGERDGPGRREDGAPVDLSQEVRDVEGRAVLRIRAREPHVPGEKSKTSPATVSRASKSPSKYPVPSLMRANRQTLAETSHSADGERHN